MSLSTTTRFMVYAFTANTPTERTKRIFTKSVEKHENVRAIIFQLERGSPTDSSTGTVHLQGTIALIQKMSWKRLAKMLGLENAGIHWENVKDLQGSIDYCRAKAGEVLKSGKVKGGFVYEGSQFHAGIFQMRGKRKDLDAIGLEIASGEFDLEELKVNNFGTWARNHRALALRISEVRGRIDLRLDYQPPAVRVYWGPTNTGKSYRARAECLEQGLHPYTAVGGTSTCFFDGFEEGFHDVIIFDDFYGWYPYDRMLVLCDRYPTSLQIKGSMVSILPLKRVYITSNDEPGDWWPRTAKKELEKNKTVLSAFARRLGGPGSGIFELKEPFLTQVGGVTLNPPTGVEIDPTPVSPNFTWTQEKQIIAMEEKHRAEMGKMRVKMADAVSRARLGCFILPSE